MLPEAATCSHILMMPPLISLPKVSFSITSFGKNADRIGIVAFTRVSIMYSTNKAKYHSDVFLIQYQIFLSIMHLQLQIHTYFHLNRSLEVVCLISSSIFFIEHYIHFFVYMLNLSSLNISHFLI